MYILKKKKQDFPGEPVVKTLCFHCRGEGGGFDSYSGLDPSSYKEQPKKKKKQIREYKLSQPHLTTREKAEMKL